MADTIPALERLGGALTPLPVAAIAGYQMSITGTVNTVGGGTGGTSMTDNNAFTPSSTSITPVGGYHGGRSVASGNAAAFAIDGSGNMQVNVVAGGAGGGIANISVRGTANSDIHVGFASGAGLYADGGAALPITGTVNVSGVVGSVNAVLGTLPVPMVGSVNVTGSLGVGQLAGPWTMVGSVNVTAVSTQTVTFGGNATVWYGGPYADTTNSALRVNVVAGGAGGGLAQIQVIGSDNSTWLNVGQASGHTDLFHAVPIFGTVNTVGGGGTSFASVAVYGSPANPVYNVGSVNVVNNVGVTQVTSPWVTTGSVNITGSINPVGIFGSVNVVGSVNAVLGTLPVPMVGSVNVTPQGIQVVDVRGSITPTQWAIQLGASGPNVLFNAPAAGAIKLYGLTMVANATVTYRLQSPSGTDLTGSITLLPGAGVVELAPIRDPIYTGAATATWNLWLSSAAAVGGIARGWVE